MDLVGVIVCGPTQIYGTTSSLKAKTDSARRRETYDAPAR